MKNDVIIIGGGAAGLCAAVALKKRNDNLSVRLLEALPRVGKKLAATGNGRCNITNKNIDISRYHGKHPDFAEYALTRFDRAVCEEFFKEIGVDFVFEGDRLTPRRSRRLRLLIACALRRRNWALRYAPKRRLRIFRFRAGFTRQ